MAAFWKWQRSAESTARQVVVIVTTLANALMAPIHDPMPVVLDESLATAKQIRLCGHDHAVGAPEHVGE